MQITILAVGSQGDVQPYIALGAGLKDAGHQVQLATHSNFQVLVESQGLFFAEVQGNPREWLDTDAGLDWLESQTNLLGFFKGLKKFMAPVLERLLPTSFAACKDSDAILYSSLAVSGPHIGEKLRRPSFPLMLQPVYPTGEFCSVLTYTGKKTGKVYNQLTHFITDQILYRSSQAPINRWRRQVLDLPPAPFLGPFRKLRQRKVPHFLAYSENVVPRPADWKSHVHVTGYWFLKSKISWTPPEALLNFLRAGPPPVYVGFGSMTIRNPAVVTECIVEALRLAGQRGILLAGWGELGHQPLPEHIFPTQFIPHDWLFERVSAVVHHGGAGTTAAGLRAGLPTIVTPFFADQFFWAARVNLLGVGPPPIPYAQLDAQKLGQSIRVAVQETSMRTRARELGKKIAAEDGVGKTVALLNQALATGA